MDKNSSDYYERKVAPTDEEFHRFLEEKMKSTPFFNGSGYTNYYGRRELYQGLASASGSPYPNDPESWFELSKTREFYQEYINNKGIAYRTRSKTTQ